MQRYLQKALALRTTERQADFSNQSNQIKKAAVAFRAANNRSLLSKLFLESYLINNILRDFTSLVPSSVKVVSL
jgi:hypothetical protein